MKKLIILLMMIINLTTFAQQVQNFSLVNVIDGKTTSLNNYTSNSGVVIIFMVNACAFDDYYIDRIKALGQHYKDKTPVLLVNSDSDEEESETNMVKRAKQVDLTVPYLADKDQVLLQSMNAHKSVEAFLLKNTAGKFFIFYRGAIDDNPQVAKDVKHTYLADAIDKMLAGQTVEPAEIRPTGCTIRKK